MKILALESSAKAASAALCEDGKLLSQYWQNSGLTHSRTLLAMAEDMLKNLELDVQAVDVVAVAKGPGSFTGIRIGVAAAKGLAWGAGKPVCGVSTLEAMAWHLAGCGGVICPVMDARRAQVYNAKFLWADSRPVRVCPDRAISLQELLEEAENDEKTYFLVGDGAELCYNAFLEAGLRAELPPMPLVQQSAWGVAMAAAGQPLEPAHDLTPNYLRLSQAERERLEKENNK